MDQNPLFLSTYVLFASAQVHWGQPPPTSIAGRNGFVKKKREKKRQRVAYVGWEEIVKRWEGMGDKKTKLHKV